MAQQKAQGTITIIDTTDKNIFIRYSANVDGSNSTSSPVSNTKYIGIYCGTAQTETEAMASSSGWTWSEYIGTDGVSVTGITEIYQLRNDSATPTKRSDGTALPTAVDTVNTWSLKVPSYVSGGTYWTSTAVSMSEAPSPRYTTPVKNEALTDSNYNSVMANSIAQSANENANGAMGQANNGIKEIYRVWYRTNSGTTPNKPSTHVTETSNNVNNIWTKVKPIEDSNYCYYFYCEETITNGGVSSWTNPVLDMSTLSKYEVEALDSRTKTFFFPGDSSYPGAYVVGKDSNNGLDKTDISTYGFNTRVTTTGISIGYNTAKVLHLKTTPSPASLDFYKPPTISGNTVTEGELAASLSATGLILSKGGVKAGSYNSTASDEDQNFVYLSSEDYGIGTKIGDSASDKTDWRQIIGKKFGVDKAGNLYAAGAHIDGDIIAQSLTIGSGANAYSGIAAINITGYSIEIEVADIAGSTETKKLIPHLLHNGENADSEVIDKTDFIWYVDSSTSGIQGDSVDGSITGAYGSSYRVIYDFDDGAVEGGTATRTLTVDPSKYITRIDADGITIHPENQSGNSWVQLDGTGLEIFDNTSNSLAKYGSNVRIGQNSIAHIIIGSGGLDVYNNTQLISHLGFNSTINSGTIPYFTFGQRVNESNIGSYSVAEGYNTIASGNYSHSGGQNAQSIGNYSFAYGLGVKATTDGQTVLGKWNTEDSDAMFILGNGIDNDNRSNLMVISDNSIVLGSKQDRIPYIQIDAKPSNFSTFLQFITYNNNQESIRGSIFASGSSRQFIFMNQSDTGNTQGQIDIGANSVKIQGWAHSDDIRYSGTQAILKISADDYNTQHALNYFSLYNMQDQLKVNIQSFLSTDDTKGYFTIFSDNVTINSNGNVEAAGYIQVPKDESIYLDGDNHINKFYCSTVGGTDNIYYKTDGYHAFLTADSTTRFYIQNTQVNSNVPYKAGGVKLFTIGWTTEVDNAQIAANGYADYKITIPSKSNYTPIAVVGYYFANATTNGANSSSISCNMVYYLSSENKARLMCRNHASSIARVRYAAAILYVATIQGI